MLIYENDCVCPVPFPFCPPLMLHSWVGCIESCLQKLVGFDINFLLLPFGRNIILIVLCNKNFFLPKLICFIFSSLQNLSVSTAEYDGELLLGDPVFPLHYLKHLPGVTKANLPLHAVLVPHCSSQWKHRLKIPFFHLRSPMPNWSSALTWRFRYM